MDDRSMNALRLAEYRKRMMAQGFRRRSFYVAPELILLLDKEHRSGECGGRTLERLLLGKEVKRPDWRTPEEQAAHEQKMQVVRNKYAASFGA